MLVEILSLTIDYSKKLLIRFNLSKMRWNEVTGERQTFVGGHQLITKSIGMFGCRFNVDCIGTIRSTIGENAANVETKLRNVVKSGLEIFSDNFGEMIAGVVTWMCI